MEVHKVLFLLLLQSSVYFLKCEGRPFVMLIPYIATALAPALTALATWSGTTAGAGAVASIASAFVGSLSNMNMRTALTTAQTHTTTAMTAVTPALANTAAQITNMARDHLNEQMKPENLQQHFKTGLQYTVDNQDTIAKNIGMIGQIRAHMDFLKSRPALEIRFTEDTSEEHRKASLAMLDWRTTKSKQKYLTRAETINPHDKEYLPIEVTVKRYRVRHRYVKETAPAPVNPEYKEEIPIVVVVKHYSVLGKKSHLAAE